MEEGNDVRFVVRKFSLMTGNEHTVAAWRAGIRVRDPLGCAAAADERSIDGQRVRCHW